MKTKNVATIIGLSPGIYRAIENAVANLKSARNKVSFLNWQTA